MNITNIQNTVSAAAFMPKSVYTTGEAVSPTTEDGAKEALKIKEIPLPGTNKNAEKDKTSEKNLDHLVMKPSPISLEERMAQVISAEQVKDLLSLISRFSIQDGEEVHKLDEKR